MRDERNLRDGRVLLTEVAETTKNYEYMKFIYLNCGMKE